MNTIHDTSEQREECRQESPPTEKVSPRLKIKVVKTEGWTSDFKIALALFKAHQHLDINEQINKEGHTILSTKNQKLANPDTQPVAPHECDWMDNLTDYPDSPFVNEASVGVDNAEDCSKMSAEQLFGLFFMDYLFSLIVGETNRYASQCCQQEPKKGRKHAEVTVPELKTWLSLLLMMGLGVLISSSHEIADMVFAGVLSHITLLQLSGVQAYLLRKEMNCGKCRISWHNINKRFRTAYHPRRE
ncbi:hypothetical protein LSH36_853g00001 [Paralvinella palmiformis]|uniref:PiggyBac transposable element-derived protein domain-containing protein n=1 Tax=Paralvinella palmiformis TaxID=53620 RepID=A0AAD9IZ19_9ANNE|nr:hypothetical protein LSH36_853g00001 [Paralvinella palmiformis]